MKPLRIEFAAFGSYPGVVSVDFTALAARGLFVVTGDTGTGKTTIFDAMSYALFGEMPLKPGHDIRSHHADASQPTYARFTFEVGDATYVAERSPDQLRPALRGGGFTNDKAKASLTRIDRSATTSLATKVNEMKRAVAEVVGLDAEQFRRVMLLPQGEVARFLLDESSDRETLLSALFGGDVYDRIGTALQQEAARLGREVAHADETLRHHLANARTRLVQLQQLLDLADSLPDDLQRDAFEALVGQCSAPLAALRHDSEMATLDAAARATALTEGKHSAHRFQQAVEIRTSLDDLDRRSPEVEARARAADASARARPVVTAAGLHAEQAATLAEAGEAVDSLLAAVEQVAHQHDLEVRSQPGEALTADLEALAATVREHTDLLDALAGAVEDLATAEQEVARNRDLEAGARTTLDLERGRLEVIDTRVAALHGAAEALTRVDGETKQLQDALTDVESRDRARSRVHACAEALRSAEDISEQVLRRYIDTTAPRLAAQLRPGAPCPVCGSSEHPAPAVVHDGDPVDLDAVAAAQAAVDDVRQELQRATADLGEFQARLGEWAQSSAEHLQALLEDSRKRLAAARADSDELVALASERTDVELRRQTAQSEVDRLTGIIEAGEATVAERHLAVEACTAAAAGVLPERVEALRRVVAELRSLAGQLGRLRSEEHAAQTAVKVAAEALDQALDTSGFSDVAAAQSAMVPESEEQEALRQRNALSTEHQQLQGRLQALEQQGIPDVPPDVVQLTEAAAQSEERSRGLVARRTRADDAAGDLASELDQYDRAGAGSQDLRRRAHLTDRAQQVCRGQVGSRVSLRRWVLGRELERVVAVASVHLSQMTSGRYTIRRVAEHVGGRSARGLDLEVLDAHTGRARSPRTLSGGEQFQASLALALGLADVVSQGGAGSGKRIEALFVDEGFGSLDPRALDDAIETLHQLQATGRMIGAITHVEAMKERLHPGIVVTRLPDGKGSTLRVNP